MDTLKEGLMQFVSREFINHYGGSFAQVLQQILKEPVRDGNEHFSNMDVCSAPESYVGVLERGLSRHPWIRRAESRERVARHPYSLGAPKSILKR